MNTTPTTSHDVQQLLADTVLGATLGFTVGDRRFRLYPATLAKVLLARTHLAHIAQADVKAPHDSKRPALHFDAPKMNLCSCANSLMLVGART